MALRDKMSTSAPGGRVDRRGWSSLLARWLPWGRSRAETPTEPPEPVARYRNVCISREAGAGGGTIARLVGKRLNWKVYDHELLEAIASGMQVPVDEARIYDELSPSVIQDWLLPLREEHYAPQEAYLDHLAKLVESIGKAGESIIVGRGAGFLLPRESTLCVRVIAPLKARAQRLSERMGVSVRTARRAARDLDSRSHKFARTMYRVDASDPHHYDLVVDSHSLGLTVAVDLIARTVELGLPQNLAAAKNAHPTPSWQHEPRPAEAADDRGAIDLGEQSNGAAPSHAIPPPQEERE
jgi:cytidylate kinase